MKTLLAAILISAMAVFGVASADIPVIQPDYTVNLYGYTKLDACYDTSRTSAGNFAQWVEPGKDDDNQFNMTARQTRLGLNFSGPSEDGAKTSGRLELDFYGGGAENKNLPH